MGIFVRGLVVNQTYSTVTDVSKSSHIDDSLINQPSIQVCFKVSKRFNNLLNEVKPQGYSYEQMGIYRLIKSLFDKGLSYREITKHLNERGIKLKNCMKDKNVINY